MENIKFKSSILPVVLGILMLVIAAIFELTAVLGFAEDGEDGVIATIAISVFFVLPMVLVSILSFWSFAETGKHLRRKLKEYGEAKIISHIKTHTVYTYKGITGAKTYFTDKLIVDPKNVILDYNEISYMYKSVSSARTGRIQSLAVELWDGSSWSVCSGMTNVQLGEVMQLCYKYNPHILCGYTKENMAAQKQRVAEFKRGNKISPRPDLEEKKAYAAQASNPAFTEEKKLQVPYEWTPQGEKEARAKGKKTMGIILMITGVFFFVLMTAVTFYFAYEYHMPSNEIPILIAFITGFMVAFGGLFLVGFLLFREGKKK